MSSTDQAPGCRSAAVATSLLLGIGVVFMATGLSLSQRADCSAMCEVAALTMLYAGGPLSGVVGVIFGGVHLLWPLEITLWVVLGFWAARRADRRGTSVAGAVVVIVGLALAYGLVLSRFVEIAV